MFKPMGKKSNPKYKKVLFSVNMKDDGLYEKFENMRTKENITKTELLLQMIRHCLNDTK